MMPAAKHYDPVMGIDIHIIQPPGPVPPVPIPHPFVGILFDAFDYVPMLGATVYVNGIPRAQAGTAGKGMPPHIPIGGVFVKPPTNECEMFMGSATVSADGDAFSFMSLPVLSCQCIGIPPPPRIKKKSKTKSLVAPTSIVMPIPAGMPVLVGGPPTISLAALGMKAGMAGLGKGLKKLRKLQKSSKRMKALAKSIHEKARKAMDKLKIPPSVRNKVHRAVCTVTGHPVDVATGKVFTEKVDFEIPGPIPFKWERVWYSTSVYQGPLGHGWHHSYDMALAFDVESQAMALRLPDGRSIGFPTLGLGEESYNRQERLTMFRDEQGYGLRNTDRLTFRFQVGGTDLHLLTTIENNSGHKIAFSYDQQEHLTLITDSAGRPLEIISDTQGRIIAILAPHPEKPGKTFKMVAYSYDRSGNLTEVRDALDYPATYAYRNYLLVQETDRNGLSFYFEYDRDDADARCLRTWGDKGIYDHKMTYHADQQLTVVENSLGHRTRYYYNSQGVVISTIDPQGNTSTTEYNEHSQVVAETDELGRVTSYTYDERGNRIGIKAPDGSTISMEYQEDLLTQATDELGGPWQWEYDDQSRLIARTDALGNITQYAYQEGKLTEIIDPAGRKTQLAYDAFHNLNQLTTPEGATSHWVYDAMGRCLEVIDPKGNVQGRKFDLLGQIILVEEPDENRRILAYDREGNVIRAQDQQHDVGMEYSGMGRITARIEAGTRVEFHYNTEEQLIGIKNEHGFAYRFELDPQGNVALESGFDQVTRRYKRNAAGQVIAVSRPHGMVTQYEYNLGGQVIEVQHTDGSSENYAYRADGLLTKAANDATTVRFERDLLGRVLKEVQGDHTVESAYDVLGRRSRVTSSLGASLSFVRNLMGDVEEITAQSNTTSWEASMKHDIMGMEIEKSMPGGIRSRWQRDQLGRPVQHQITGSQGQTFLDKKYIWDVNDQLRQVIDANKGTTRYEHDGMGNLASAQYAEGIFEYRLPDTVGNLFRHKDRTDRQYGPSGQLLVADGVRYDYDAEGNLVKKTTPHGRTWHYVWNAAGMLSAVIRPDGEKVTFTYDALGRRLSKTYKNKTTRWVWDGNNPLHEWVEKAPVANDTGKSNLWQSILEIVGAGHPTAHTATAPTNGPPGHPDLNELITWVFEPESFTPTAKLHGQQHYSIVTDYLGTPVGMYDKQGEQVWAATLSIYGKLRNLQGEPGACPFRWPGQYEDEETGLYYNRFRYYDPGSGEYISQDPIDIAGGNQFYSYVHDPLCWIDIFGLSSEPLPAGTHRIEGRDMAQRQGRQFRQDWLEVHEFDPNQPKHVRGWLRQERNRLARGQATAPRNPPGYVMAHGRTTPAREGFDYANSRLQHADLNQLEERVRKQRGCP